jgi:acetolactate synthase-1/2/3 large subunit
MSSEAWWTRVEADEWGDAIVAAMKLGGVDNIFFVSGSELNFYQEAVAKAQAKGSPAPRIITLPHESVALNAALGNAMFRRQPSATAVHVDAGTLHQGAGIHTAWRGDYPVLMTAGTGPRAFPGSMPGGRNHDVQWVQEPRDQGEIVRQFTKMDHRMEHQDNPGLMVSRLLQVAMSSPPGPVYLAIPRETAMLPTGGTASFPTRDQLGVARPAWPAPADAAQIAAWLVDARDPLICTERSGREPDAHQELVRLAELLAIPVAESDRADRMNFPMTHWAYGTGASLADADVVLVMDAIVPFTPGIIAPHADARVTWVSSDPVLSRYKTVEQRANLWLTASVASVARAVHDAAKEMLTPERRARIAERRAGLEERKRQVDQQDDALAVADIENGQLTGRVVAYELGRLLREDAIVLNDGLSNGGYVHTYSRRSKDNTYFRSGSTSGGWGGGASVGVKLAAPDQDVVHASGDGYFMFGNPLLALWSAAHHSAPYLSVVFVNGTYSTGTTSLRATYPQGYAVSSGNYDGGSFEPPPNFATMAEAANSYGEEVSTLAQLVPALERGFEKIRTGTPAVIAVRVPGPLG